MGTQNKQRTGFTIIEIMLFFAISGALAAAVLVTSTTAINNQRYIDAVNSLKAQVQEEFVNTTRVINTRDGDNGCAVEVGIPAMPVGASECVIIGRLMSIGGSGQITSSNIIAKEPSIAADLGATDVEAIKSYLPTVGIDMSQQETEAMAWDTTIQRGNSNQAVSIAILRSPSGNVLSFVKNTQLINDNDLRQYMNSSEFNNNVTKNICVDPSGWTISRMQAIVIPKYAAGPSAVEQRNAESSECN